MPEYRGRPAERSPREQRNSASPREGWRSSEKNRSSEAYRPPSRDARPSHSSGAYRTPPRDSLRGDRHDVSRQRSGSGDSRSRERRADQPQRSDSRDSRGGQRGASREAADRRSSTPNGRARRFSPRRPGCFICDARDHWARECPKATPEIRQQMRTPSPSPSRASRTQPGNPNGR